MISPLAKIFLRPLVRAVDSLLERLQRQIRDGQKDEAIQTVTELREVIKSATEKFL